MPVAGAPNGPGYGPAVAVLLQSGGRAFPVVRGSITATARAPAKAEKAPAAALESSTLRVSVEKVDQLINLVGELVITQAMLAQNGKGVDAALYQQLASGLADLERNTRDLQEAVMSIRMIPMSLVFNRFPRMLRDLAAKLGKKVDFVTLGEATELDKGLVEKITDPLTHLVRNSCDHGIELPADRLAAGKPETGTITLSASHQGSSIVIEVRDAAGALTEVVPQRVGIRRFGIENGVLSLNGDRVVFNGINRHEFGLNGRVPSRELTESDIASIDSALLLDDLPPDAYTDPGFLQFLKVQLVQPTRHD